MTNGGLTSRLQWPSALSANPITLSETLSHAVSINTGIAYRRALKERTTSSPETLGHAACLAEPTAGRANPAPRHIDLGRHGSFRQLHFRHLVDGPALGTSLSEAVRLDASSTRAPVGVVT